MSADSPVLPWKPITHGTIADYFARSNTLPRNTLANPSYGDRLANPTFFDVGPGNVKIRTAITMLQNYNQMFPDYDPLHLKRYNDHYDVAMAPGGTIAAAPAGPAVATAGPGDTPDPANNFVA